MASSPFDQIVKPRLLVGEGRDEVNFFESLLTDLQIYDVQVVDYGGKPKLKPFLATLPRIPGFSGLQAIGITQDADDDPAAAVQSIEHAIHAAALPAGLRTSKFVMPGENTPGALESLCNLAIAKTSLGSCIESYLICAVEAGLEQKWSIGNAAKARLQAWLAVQNEPGKRLGEAARTGLLNWDDTSFGPLKSFITNL